MSEPGVWYSVKALTGQCSWCKHKEVDATLAACEHTQPMFPHATKCAWYEPEDMDE